MNAQCTSCEDLTLYLEKRMFVPSQMLGKLRVPLIYVQKCSITTRLGAPKLKIVPAQPPLKVEITKSEISIETNRLKLQCEEYKNV